jgi:hypothetical protein
MKYLFIELVKEILDIECVDKLLSHFVYQFRKDALILGQTGNVGAKVIGNMRCLNRLKRWMKTCG